MAAGLATSIEYRGIDPDLVARCYQIWTDLDRIETKVEDAIREAKTEDLSLCSFVDALVNYKELLRRNLRISAGNASATLNEQVEELIRIAENHPLFKPSRLNQWLLYKQFESEMTEIFAEVKGIAFLGKRNQLELSDLTGYFGKKFVLVLSVPPLDKVTTKILTVMENTENLIKEEIRWYMIDNHWYHVMDKFSEMANQVDKISKENRVQFVITFDENDEDFGCHFSLYEDEMLLVDKLDRFPCSPTALRIRSSVAPARKTTLLSICVEWDYQVLGYPCEFLVEYRPKCNSGELWTRKKTTTSSICIEFGPAMEVRVAMDTCVGPSEFSPVLFIPKASIQRPPYVKSVIQTTAELKWPSQTSCVENRSFTYRIWYWKNTEDSQIHETDAGFATSYRLQQLTPDTSYSVRIVAVSNDGLESSAPSEIVVFTTMKIRFAETVAKQWRVIHHSNNLDYLAVPLTESATCDKVSMKWFVFGVKTEEPNKTILLVGANGSAKASFVHSLLNYVFNVEWSDPFRFQLDVDGHEDRTNIYHINYSEGFRTSYSLTIVDTPSVNGVNTEQNIADNIRQLFYGNCVRKLDMICLVTPISSPRSMSSQLRTFESVLTIFGKDVKKNISCVVAVPEDNPLCPVNCEIPSRHHKFFSFDFFSLGGNCNEPKGKWQMDNLQRFFADLDAKESTSVTKTQQVMEVRKRLQETLLDEVLSLNKLILTKREEMANKKEMIAKCQEQIYGNHKRKRQTEMVRKVDLPVGQFATNCDNCVFTCIEATVGSPNGTPCSRGYARVFSLSGRVRLELALGSAVQVGKHLKRAASDGE